MTDPATLGAEWLDDDDPEVGEVAAKITNMKHGGDRGNQHSGGRPQICSLPNGHAPVSQTEAAKPRLTATIIAFRQRRKG